MAHTSETPLTEWRCKQCNALFHRHRLTKPYRIVTKCPKCNLIQTIQDPPPEPERRPDPRRVDPIA